MDSQFFAELFDAPEFEREFLEQSIPRGNHNSPLATLPRRPMIHYEANSASVDISPKRIKLPALDVSIRQRQRVFLNTSGPAEVGYEEILEYQEAKNSTTISPFHLEFSGRCREKPPIRNRDKKWIKEELPELMPKLIRDYRMSSLQRCQGEYFQDRWRFHHRVEVDGEPKELKTMKRKCLVRKALMISKTFTVTSIFAAGFSGRVYDAALKTSRYILIEAFIPIKSVKHTLLLTLNNLEELFLDRPSMLIPGKRHELCLQLLSMLYFEYPEPDKDITEVSAAGESSRCNPEIPTLHIGPELLQSMAYYRRLDYHIRLQEIANQKRRQFEELMATAKRARYRLYCISKQVEGFRFVVSIYRYPTERRSLKLVAYHPKTCSRYTLALGLVQAARSADMTIDKDPENLSAHECSNIARRMVGLIRLEREGQEVSLCVGARIGFAGPSITLDGIQTTENLDRDVLRADIRNQIISHELKCERECSSIMEEASRMRQAYEETINFNTDAIEELEKKLLKNSKMLDSIDAGTYCLEESGDENLQRSDVKKVRRQRQRERKKLLKDESNTLKSSIRKLEADTLQTKTLMKRDENHSKTEVDNLQRSVEHETKALELVLEKGKIVDLCSATSKHCSTCSKGRNPSYLIGKGIKLARGACSVSGSFGQFVLFHTMPKTGVVPEPTSRDCSYRLCFWETETSQEYEVELTREDVIAWTKQDFHDSHKEIPGLFPYAAGMIDPRTAELDALKEILSSKTDEFKKACPRDRCDLYSDIKAIHAKMLSVQRWDLWRCLGRSLAQRLRLTANADAPFEKKLWIDSTIYIGNCKLESSTRGDEMYFRADVMQAGSELKFELHHPSSCEKVMAVHPSSEDLIKEFEPLGFVERHIQISIVLSTISYSRAKDTGAIELSFE